MQLLGSGGMIPFHQPFEVGKGLSPRRKGVRQGAVLLLAGAVLVPVLGVLNGFTEGPSFLDVLVPLAAIVFFVGGLMRMLYAALFEEGVISHQIIRPPYAVAPALQVNAPVRNPALPPAPVDPASSWRPRTKTGEVRQPQSVTENTTRLLDKDEPGSR